MATNNDPITFKEFGIFIQAGRITEAAMALTILLNLNDQIAQSAAQTFANKAQNNPDAFMQLMALKAQIEAGEDNASLKTLMDCFGIDGPNSVVALQAAKKVLAG